MAPVKLTVPSTAIFPPPDSAVKERITAVLPLSAITPFAFEMPFGKSV